MWNLRRNDTNKLTYKTERDLQIWRTSLWLLGWVREGWGRDNWGVWDGCVHTAWFQGDPTNPS